MTRARQIRISLAAPLLGAALATASCAAIERSHGYFPDKELIEQVRPGVHDKDSVASLLGAPTTVTAYRDEAWYYIAKRSERLAFLEEDIVEQKVLAVHFDERGIVEDVKTYTLDDAEQVALVDRETATRGKELTLMQQLFGNIGRFTNDGSGSQ